eukprot:118052-Chlamydomonas_euryale.AAC.1
MQLPRALHHAIKRAGGGKQGMQLPRALPRLLGSAPVVLRHMALPSGTVVMTCCPHCPLRVARRSVCRCQSDAQCCVLVWPGSHGDPPQKSINVLPHLLCSRCIPHKQVAGIKFAFNPSNAVGSRLVEISLADGSPIDDCTDYYVVTNKYACAAAHAPHTHTTLPSMRLRSSVPPKTFRTCCTAHRLGCSCCRVLGSQRAAPHVPWPDHTGMVVGGGGRSVRPRWRVQSHRLCATLCATPVAATLPWPSPPSPPFSVD